MLLMALDHVRDFFHHDSFYIDPTDLQQTTVPLFLTRFITHFCAPVFVFLAGTSAFFVGERMTQKQELSAWLVKRGFWLVFLEFTVVKFGWFFTLNYNHLELMVIWAIGVSMITLAAAIHLPKKLLFALGILLVAGHNTLDFYTPPGDTYLQILWNILHVQSPFDAGNCAVFIVYPLLPWMGLMMLGYCMGNWYTSTYSATKRKKLLIGGGLFCWALFILLRIPNLYGEPNPWDWQTTPSMSMLSFINVSKYPPSLDYVLITIGFALLFLGLFETLRGKLSEAITVIGRVPMFYYILHIYLIHFLAMLAAGLTGFNPFDMVTDQFISMIPTLKGYGFSLPVTYLIWILVVVLLYPLCRWYNRYKSSHRHHWWLSYL
jgi:uncharacterized membrane protein